MKTVLIDASSAILLHKAHIFEPIADLYRLQMAPAVYREITVAHHSGAEVFEGARDHGKIHVMGRIPWGDSDGQMRSLHAGERETIMAYNGKSAHFIIMDDGKGARACRTRDIPHINALLCPNILHLSGRIDGDACHAAFRRLKKIGRYGDEVIAYAEKATRKNLAPFFP